MRRGYLIALILALVVAYWGTGRADAALAPFGLNKTDCYQVFGTYHCGKDAEKIAELKNELR